MAERVSGSTTSTGEARAIGRHSLADSPGRQGLSVTGHEAARIASPNLIAETSFPSPAPGISAFGLPAARMVPAEALIRVAETLNVSIDHLLVDGIPRRPLHSGRTPSATASQP